MWHSLFQPCKAVIILFQSLSSQYRDCHNFCKSVKLGKSCKTEIKTHSELWSVDNLCMQHKHLHRSFWWRAIIQQHCRRWKRNIWRNENANASKDLSTRFDAQGPLPCFYPRGSSRQNIFYMYLLRYISAWWNLFPDASSALLFVHFSLFTCFAYCVLFFPSPHAVP